MFATEQARLEGLVHIGRKQGTEPPDGGGDLSPPEEKGSGKAHQPGKADKEDSMLMWRIHEVRELGLVWHPKSPTTATPHRVRQKLDLDDKLEPRGSTW